MKQALILIAAGAMTLTSCGMFYSKVGDRPGEDPTQSGKVSITDVATTEYQFGGEASAFNNSLSYSINVATAGTGDIAFGHEFSLTSKAKPEVKATGRLFFKPSGDKSKGHSAMVLLKTEGITITHKGCVKAPGTSDTPISQVPVDSDPAFGLDAVDNYTCMLPGTWLPGKTYTVGMVNAEADGLAIKISGEGFENDKGYLKLEAFRGMQMAPKVKAFTRALKAFGNCAALPTSKVSFGQPKLDGMMGQTVGGSTPIPACVEAIIVECTPTGCRHVVNPVDTL